VDRVLPLLHSPFRAELKDNYQQVKTYTERMEKRLIKQGRVEEFNSQFRDTVERGVFRELSEEELKEWKGPLNYIAMVEAFKNGPHATTPLRICMKSSLKQPPPVKKSLNDCLMKAGLWIRIHFFRIRIQSLRLETNTDPDPIPIQGFNDQKLKKKYS
jgi:hypothetical protein